MKPKHKKTSFDDRQLPIIPNVNRDQPWFDKDNLLQESPSTKAISQELKQKPTSLQLERKHKKHRTESAHLSSSKTDVGICDGDNNNIKSRPKEHSRSKELRKSSADKKSSSVAVVQPRKKEKMDEKKLMETIVKMQIKKNSMDNRNNNRKNGNVAVNEFTKITDDTKKILPKENSGNYY